MMPAAYTLRAAAPRDADALAAIYNDAVLNGTAIWNETTTDAEGRRAWMEARHARGFPILVAVDAADRVAGYASYGDWRPFEGFRHTVEHSVYVAAEARGAGLGRVLLTALIEEARTAGRHVMVAAIEAGNVASIRLHEKLGFVERGRMPQVGAKFGRWLDLVFLQLVLDAADTPPDARETPASLHG
ncbi:GNAT family N-acetyltransferase [Pacificitalea manganoxidans]|nr:GNAT family N-acetyltransferase [Pacificitalea manganoxidans]MDR6308573.1 phosphinothricin acetyltransferase [Pacificitalea manganoxidans]